MLEYNLPANLRAELREEGLKTNEYKVNYIKTLEQELFAMLMSPNKQKWSEWIDNHKIVYASYITY